MRYSNKNILVAFSNKKAVSLMLSYVLLIAIAISMSIAVYTWLKVVANVEPVPSCEEETSIIISSYKCEESNFKLSVKNNGRFNVDGFILEAGDDPEKSPVSKLLPISERISNEGYYIFESPLSPGNEDEALFTYKEKGDGGIERVGFDSIKVIRIQPFIIHESGNKIVCGGSVIKQEIINCDMQ